MFKVAAVVLVLVFCIASISHAQSSYVISLNGNINSSTPYSNNNTTGYDFFPYISVTKDGSASTAFVTLSSPDDSFIGYANNPSSIAAQSTNEPDTASVVSPANGQWMMEIKDGADTFDYTMDVSLTLPFDNLPVLRSPELVNGGNYPGTFHFSIVGGSAAYPGPAMQVRGQLFATDFSAEYADETLAPGATSWTPSADLTGVSQLLAFLRTTSEAIDTTALSITNIEPTDMDEPDVSFDATTLRYSSDASAQLNVPEPASIAWLAASALALARRRRR